MIILCERGNTNTETIALLFKRRLKYTWCKTEDWSTLGVNSNSHWMVFQKTESILDAKMYFEIYLNINIREKRILRICNKTRHVISINPEFNLKVIYCYRRDKQNCLLPPSKSIFHKSIKFWNNAKDGIMCFLY